MYRGHAVQLQTGPDTQIDTDTGTGRQLYVQRACCIVADRTDTQIDADNRHLCSIHSHTDRDRYRPGQADCYTEGMQLQTMTVTVCYRRIYGQYLLLMLIVYTYVVFG